MKVKGRKYNFLKVRRRLPNGKVTDLEMIEHPGAALIIPFLTSNKIIFLRQFRVAINQYIYELPAGTLERNESPLACARRELIEETNHKAKKFEPLGKIFPVPGYSNEVIFIYKAQGLEKAEGFGDSDEIIQTKVLAKREAQLLFRKGRIQDAKTICALAKIGWV